MESKPTDPDTAAAQQRFLSLFLRSEREIFRYVGALVPNVANAEGRPQRQALAASDCDLRPASQTLPTHPTAQPR